MWVIKNRDGEYWNDNTGWHPGARARATRYNEEEKTRIIACGNLWADETWEQVDE
jgi:hypothetical protein